MGCSNSTARDSGSEPTAPGELDHCGLSTNGRALLRKYCGLLPKAELHAHINGSIPQATLGAMYDAMGYDPNADTPTTREKHRLEREALTTGHAALMDIPAPPDRMRIAFRAFDGVYFIVNSIDRLEQGLRAVLAAYRDEGTVFLELRTSLRELQGKPREAYLRAVCRVLDQWDEEEAQAIAVEADAARKGKAPKSSVRQRMAVKLLVSINRGSPVQAAQEAIALAVKLHDEQKAQLSVAAETPLADMVGEEADSALSPRIVGIDFSGNCYKGKFAEFAPALRKAQKHGLRVTLHVGEKEDDAELKAMLDFGPDRIGHLVFAGDALRERVARSSTPLELCITSNLMTSNWTVADHHVAEWFQQGHPISINTDDRGVFDTTMSKELELFAEALLLTEAKADDDTPQVLATGPVIGRLTVLPGRHKVPAAEAARLQQCLRTVAAVGRDAINHGFCSAREKRDALQAYDATMQRVQKECQL